MNTDSTPDGKARGRGFLLTPCLLALIGAVLLYQAFVYVPQWEYRTSVLGSYEAVDGAPPTVLIREQLTALGDEGWELISFETLSWADDREVVEARVAMRRKQRGP